MSEKTVKDLQRSMSSYAQLMQAKNCHTLKRIDLRNNGINGLDVEPLANLLVASPSLLTLNLSFNELGNKGASTLIEGLKKNGHLIRLELNGNNISEAIQDEIDGMLRVNGKKNPETEFVSSRAGTATNFNTQKFERVVYAQQGLDLGNTGFRPQPMAEAERFLDEERTRGIVTHERMAKQVDDMMMKDLRGAQLIKELESK